LLALGTYYHNDVLRWSAVPVGVATGWLLAWWLGRVAVRVLRSRGPELLLLMRTGRAPLIGARASRELTARTKVQMSKRDAAIAGFGWSLGPILLVPQGIVPVILLAVHPSVKVWFLAMYLPAPLGWACAAAMVVLGSWLIWLAIRAGRRDKPAEHAAAR
jgi:ABC-2 type transport system permease protein